MEQITNEHVQVFRKKANQANQPRRRQDEDGNWSSVRVSPVLTWQDVMTVYIRSDGRCRWCKLVVELKGTLEHIKRVADGGTNALDNLDWSCLRCNQKGYWRGS